MLKKARLLWLKKVQGVRQIARLKQRFLSFTFYKTQRSYEKICVFICCFIGSAVKIVLYLHFLDTRDDRLRQIKKKKHEWWNNRFSDAFTHYLNLKHFASRFFLTQDNFMIYIKKIIFSFNLSYYIKHRYSWKNVLTMIFEIMKKENKTNTTSFDTLIRC